MILNLPWKDPETIYSEWDALAPIRLDQIVSGRDITFNHVLAPLIFKLVSDIRPKNILDVGCGVGVLTNMLSTISPNIKGVDPSKISIQLATENFGENIDFISRSSEQFSLQTKERFSVIVANMVLMDTIYLNEFIKSVSVLLRRDGVFIFSITHPCFWPEYFCYNDEEWFDYSKELIVESPFRITNEQDCRLSSTHVHRPLEMYLSCIFEQGLVLDRLYEPLPSAEIEARYPIPWKFPRYLVAQCRLPKKSTQIY